MFKKEKGEKVEYTSTKVQYKKKSGTFYVTTHRLVWQDSAEVVSLKYDQITSTFSVCEAEWGDLERLDLGNVPYWDLRTYGERSE